MERSVYDITLDIQRSHAPATLTVKRGDTHRQLRIRLVSGGRPYPVTDDCYGVFTAQKPDGTVIYNPCTREGSILIYDLTPQTTAAPGLLACEVRLYGTDDALLTSAAFSITVEDTVYASGEEAITSTGEATALTQLITQARSTISETETVLEILKNSTTIDDTAVGANLWSSKNTVDKLCPTFAQTGSIVTCQPVEGYPLGVVTQILSAQEGEGDPSPYNIRPITGWSSVNLWQGENNYTMDLGQNVYSGSLDWQTGVLTVTWRILSLNGQETWSSWGPNYRTEGITGFLSYLTDDADRGAKNARDTLKCSHTVKEIYAFGGKKIGASIDTNTHYIMYAISNDLLEDVSSNAAATASFKAWLAAQASANTPVQICYQLATPITIQLEPQEILALSGVNTLYSDTGETTVTGRADPTAVIEKLTNAIVALGGNV